MISNNFTKSCIVFSCVTLWCHSINAILTGDRWQDIKNATEYQQLPACAQPCVLQVDATINCWSYGCVCSENTLLGSNFKTGLANVESCATNNCQNNSMDAAVTEATDAFKQLCRLYFATHAVSTSLATATSTINGTQISLVTITTTPTPTAIDSSNVENAIIIDSPDDAYQALSPCVRFVFNACKSPKDNPPGMPTNCNTSFPGDHTEIWKGLGVELNCSTSECICKIPEFYYSMQHAFDEASYLCDFTIPTQEKPSPSFEALGQMLTAFCSEKGFVLETWLLSLVGYEEQKGLDNGSIVGISTGLASFFISVASLWWAIIVYRRSRRTQETTRTQGTI